MRLIDADELIALCQTIASYEHNKKAAPPSWEYAYLDFVELIDGAQTKGADSVKHGRWIYDGNCKYHCSECRFTLEIIVEGILPHSKEKYCYNCGARMDKEAE